MKEPLVIEGVLRDVGDGCECGWLTLGGLPLREVLPETRRLDTEHSAVVIRNEFDYETGQSRHTGEPVTYDVPSWELPAAARGHRWDHVFRDWGRVRVTIEFLDEEGVA